MTLNMLKYGSMNALAITNTSELRAEIARLRAIDHELEKTLAARFSSPAAAFASALSLFPAYRNKRWQDPVTMIARVLLPMALNKTVFRRSNFLTRLVGGFAIQKAAGLITGERVESAWHGMRSIFNKRFHNETAEHYEKSI